MHTVVETDEFLRRAKENGVSLDERADIVAFIATNPKCGDEMPGTGGARKLRFAKPGHGKRGGYRIITFFTGVDLPVFLLTIYAKNTKQNISQGEQSQFRKMAKDLPKSYRKGVSNDEENSKNRPRPIRPNH